MTQDALDAFEADAVTLRAEQSFPEGPIDPSLFRAFHRHLFQDVYEWAGMFRSVRIHRDASTFCYPENIATQLAALFDWLQADGCLVGLDAGTFAAKGAHFLSELNVIHAFREGNGRTQMTFFAMLAARAAHPIIFERIEPDRFLNAMIAAFNGDETLLADQISQFI